MPDEFGGYLHVSGLTYELHRDIDSSCTSDDKGAFTVVSGVPVGVSLNSTLIPAA